MLDVRQQAGVKSQRLIGGGITAATIIIDREFPHGIHMSMTGKRKIFHVVNALSTGCSLSNFLHCRQQQPN